MRAWIFLVAACGSVACGKPAPPSQPIANHPLPGVDPDPDGGDQITFERTSGLVSAPAYRVEIHRDRIVWHGLAKVRVIGEAHGTIEPRQLDHLEVTFELVQFDERQKDGSFEISDSMGCSDVPHFKIARVRNAVRHQIDYEHDCIATIDDGVLPLEHELDALVTAWK